MFICTFIKSNALFLCIKFKKMKKLLIAAFAILVAMSCGTQKQVSAPAAPEAPQSVQPRGNGERGGQRPPGQRGQRPSVDEVFKQDTNGDGKLSRDEVQGRMQRAFDRFDVNKDGFITREEFENAPRPERRQGPPPGGDF